MTAFLLFDPLPNSLTGRITFFSDNLLESEEKYRQLAEELEVRVRERTAEIEAIHQRLELATQVVNLGVWDWNIGTGELFWDEQVYANYGLSKDTFRVNMQSFLSIVYPEDVPSLMNFTQKAMAGETSGQVEYRVLRGDNTLGYAKVHGAVLLDAEGQPKNIIGVVQDITQEKLAEQSLRESEEQNRLLFEESPISVTLLDETGHIIRVNRAYEQLTGFPRSDLYGKTAEELGLVDAKVVNGLTEAMLHAMSQQENFAVMEHSLASSDGTKRVVESRIFVLPINSVNHMGAFHLS